jgi:hypothetical protein
MSGRPGQYGYRSEWFIPSSQLTKKILKLSVQYFLARSWCSERFLKISVKSIDAELSKNPKYMLAAKRY